jgi:hypothetical protein
LHKLVGFYPFVCFQWVIFLWHLNVSC